MKPIVDFRGSQRTIGPGRALKLLALRLNNNNMPHGWHTLGIIHRGVKTVGRELSWCSLRPEYQKALAPFFIPILESK